MESESCLHRCTAALPASDVCGGTWIMCRECELKRKGVKSPPPTYLIEQMTLFCIIIYIYIYITYIYTFTPQSQLTSLFSFEDATPAQLAESLPQILARLAEAALEAGGDRRSGWTGYDQVAPCIPWGSFQQSIRLPLQDICVVRISLCFDC